MQVVMFLPSDIPPPPGAMLVVMFLPGDIPPGANGCLKHEVEVHRGRERVSGDWGCDGEPSEHGSQLLLAVAVCLCAVWCVQCGVCEYGQYPPQKLGGV